MSTLISSLRRRALLTLGLGLLLCGQIASAITVTASPTTCTSVVGIGTVNWTNPARAVASDGSYATAAVDGTTTRYLQCTGYGFAIPAAATITGITVNVERRSSSVANGGSQDAAMRIVKAGVIGTTDRSTATIYTTADVIEAHGGVADLWGDTWTAADINAATFGAAFAATKASAAGGGHTISVDHVQVTITYTLPPGGYSLSASPATCASVAGIGTVNWTNPTRAISSNNSYATASVDGTTTRYLQCNGYGFTLPATAIIEGITVNVERRSNRITDGGSRDAAMRAVKAGVIGTTDRSTATIYTTADVVEAHGGVADLWGTTWTAAEINAANFGAAFAATKASAAGAPHTISVDHVSITVTFTIPPDHIRIEHDGAGLTCSPETVTVKACADAACATLSPVSTTVTLSGAGWATNPITFTGSTTASLTVTTPSTFTLGTSAVTPIPSGTSPVCVNSGGGGACSLIFADTGFIFSTIPTQVAGVTSGNVTIQAVRKSDNSAACTGVFGGNVSIDMASQCIDPTTCNGKQVTINSTAIANNNLSASPLSYTSVLLNFGASSTATFTLNYPDVGKMSLNARYALGGGNFMTGTSNTFVVKPFGFTLTGIQRTADSFANPGAASAAGLVFIKAGDSFTATVTAIASGGAATPNYGREIAAEGVLLTPTIVLPAAGNTPSLLNGTIAGGSFTNGIATPTNLSWGEVGIITLTPSVADADYLGVGDTTGTVTGNVGRFYPHHFIATGALTNRAGLSCAPASSFTYMGEPMQLALTLTAQNTANGTTQNYTTANSFAKLDGTTASKWTTFGSADSIGLGAVDGSTALSARLSISGTPTGNWALGVGTLTANAVLNRGGSVDGPFSSLKLGIAPQDADNVLLLPGALDLDADLNLSLERTLMATGVVRYGRARLSNAHGSDLLALPVPLKTQYYNGTGFVTNSSDSCTTFTIPVSGSPCTTAACTWGDLTLTKVTMDADKTNVTISNNPLASGVSQFSLSAPLPAGTRGALDLTLNVPAWLEYNWTGVVGDPKSRVTFGLHRKADQFIYQRENY